MPHYNILFLCTGNSARSIMAEAIMNRKGREHFTAYSAGSHPTGKVRPEALRQIESANLSTSGLHSKSWDEFARPDAPVMNFVFTVCDNAASEVCPVWAGQPITAHWGVPDPAAVSGTQQEIDRAFSQTFSILQRRITLMLSLPIASLDTMALKSKLDDIGKSEEGIMFKVIFACVHNAGRSQMAAAFFNQLADPAKGHAISAGTEPGSCVHPKVLEVMREVGLDLSTAQPQLLTEMLVQNACLLVTMGCGEKCPYVPELRRDDWPIRDPKSLPIEEVRQVRDEVKHCVIGLIDQEHLNRVQAD